MTEPSPRPIIESRVQLYSALSEASELEHNFLCLYLYALCSLKRTMSEGVNPAQLAAIERWRPVIQGIALEEMTHLTLVSNLTAAIGGSPNLMRPNFPAAPGLYPANIIVELAPFDLSTLEHFIYLERPAAQEVEDGASFPHQEHYVREAPAGVLMPNASDYATVGTMYRSIREGLETLCDGIGEDRFFAGGTARQIGPLDSALPGLLLISDKASALRALDTIVVQGEGALSVQGSHFARFCAIRDEYLELLKEDPGFTPGRPVARNPVMRRPLSPEGRVWIRQPLAARYLDLANTLYAFMLRVLVQVFVVEGRAPASKRALIDTSLDTMHALASIGELLTHLAANEDTPGVHAGVTFAMVRSLAPLDSHAESALLGERLTQIVSRFAELQAELEAVASDAPPPASCVTQLKHASSLVERSRARLAAAPFAPASERERADALPVAPRLSSDPPPADPPPAEPPPADPPRGQIGRAEVARGSALSLSFTATRCIHSRHCVTELPAVFRANTPGTWLFPDEAHAELLAAVIRECPSGALQYERSDGGPAEPTPPVNLVHVRENGPYAVLASLELEGRSPGYRATLCRCGKSKNKPFCDQSHLASGFRASGEPATLKADALEQRGDTLRIDPEPNGPLKLTGNAEICSGTGRVILRTVSARLCRCGQSNTKPLCDGSHVGAGFISEAPDTDEKARDRPPAT